MRVDAAERAPTLRATWVTTFFPNRSFPGRTVFVRNLAGAMRRQVDISVTAPVPWAPPLPGIARWSKLRAVPRNESVGGIEVTHPRFIAIPALEVANGFAYGMAVRGTLSRALDAGVVDLVHVHCAYPDAVGVVRAIGSRRVPLVITAHGSDINKYARRYGLTGQIRQAIARADAVVAVSRSIAAAIAELVPGAASRISHVPCSGFDPEMFVPGAQEAARSRRGLEACRRMLLFVGNLVPVKGPRTMLAAWEQLWQDGTLQQRDLLCVIGDGPLRAALERDLGHMRSRETVRLLGSLPQPEVAEWLAASDALCLSSLNEGMPNAVIEALASGRPVAATAVGGVPDVVVDGRTGFLASPGSAEALAVAIRRVFVQEWDAPQIRQAVAGYNWDSIAERNLAIYQAVCRPP